jgi:hypothetical protein
MSVISDLAESVFGADSPRANIPDAAPTSVDEAQAAASERSAAVRKAARRDLASYIVPLNNAPAEGTGLYIPK